MGSKNDGKQKGLEEGSEAGMGSKQANELRDGMGWDGSDGMNSFKLITFLWLVSCSLDSPFLLNEDESKTWTLGMGCKTNIKQLSMCM